MPAWRHAAASAFRGWRRLLPPPPMLALPPAAAAAHAAGRPHTLRAAGHMAFSFVVLAPVALRESWESHRRTLEKQWKGVVYIGSFMVRCCCCVLLRAAAACS